MDVDLDDPQMEPSDVDPPTQLTESGDTTEADECWADDDNVYTAKTCQDVDAVACETYCADNELCDKW